MTEAFTLERLDELMAAARSSAIRPVTVDGRSYYTMAVTPRARAVLVMIEAKARWKAQYRAERIARNRGT